MNLGLSIFLSSMFLGTVALFIATKDRWHWQKIVMRSVVTALALTVIAVIATAFNYYIAQCPRVENSLWDIPLGVSKADVRFLKGEPTRVQENVWTYNPEKTDEYPCYTVGFEDDRVCGVSFIGDRQYQGPRVQGIDILDTSTDVKRRFGEPSSIATLKYNTPAFLDQWIR